MSAKTCYENNIPYEYLSLRCSESDCNEAELRASEFEAKGLDVEFLQGNMFNVSGGRFFDTGKQTYSVWNGVLYTNACGVTL